MEDNIKKILDDLYQLEPELKSKEAELIKTIEILLSAKPEIKLNSDWQANLRTELLQKFSTNKQINNLNYMQKIYYILGGAIIVAILAIPLYFYQSPTKLTNLDFGKDINLNKLDLDFEITKVDDQAFGSLAMDASAFGQRNQSGGGFGGGGGMTSSIAPSPTDEVGKIMPPYQPTAYNYIYTGEAFSIDNEQMPVYKRQKSIALQDSGSLNNIDFGLVNLNSFKNTKLQNFTLIQNGKDGYFITVDLNEGMISISENWNQWYDNSQPYDSLKPEEVPADEVIVEIADKFLSEHEVNMDTYGPGEVDNVWRVYYDLSPNKADYFIAPNFTVVYPLIIDGQEVYDQSGNKDGLRVNVNIDKNKVAGAYNILSQRYLSSNYSLETNVDKILSTAAQGGIYPEYRDANVKILDVELGTPKLVYIKSWSYQNNISEEILSPALIFPITKQPPSDEYNYFWRQNIVVPLVSEIFNQQYDGIPTPLMEKELPAEDISNQ